MPGAPASLAERAAHIGLTVRRLRQQIAEQIQKPEATLDETRADCLRDLRSKVIVRTSKGSRLEDARGDSLRIDIERKRLELDELQGLLVRIPAVEKEWTQICLTMRTVALTAPSRCAALVSPDAAPIVQETVKGVILQMLREMAHGPVAAETVRGATPARGVKAKSRKPRST